jgi:putative ABC transport system substrate-binding protein
MNRKPAHWRAGLRRRVGADAERRSTCRRLLLAFAASALNAPLLAAGQQSGGLRRIGVLDPLSPDMAPYRAFLAGLQELGYVEGKTLAIESRFAKGKAEDLAALAEDLAGRRVELIVAQSTPAVLAARRANPALPIVMVAVGDPVGDGLVASLARPGGNLTGLSILTSDIGPKALETMHAILPKLGRIAVLINPANANHRPSLKNLQAAANQIGVTLVAIEAGTPDAIESAFARMARDRPGAVQAPGDAFFRRQASQLAALALRHRLPSAFSNREIAEAGGLLSYGANIADTYRRAATYVHRILNGAKPSDLPVEQPTRFELVVNLKTAKALGLTIPQSVLVRADRVIE